MSRHGQGIGRKGAYIFVLLEVPFYILYSTYILWEIVCQITRSFHHETKGRQIPKILLYKALQSYQFTARLSVYRQVLTLNFVFTVHWSTKRESRVTNYLNMDISKRSVNLATFIASFLAVLITNTPPISSDYIELRNNARLSRPPY